MMKVSAVALLLLALLAAPPALASRCNYCRRSGGFNPRNEVTRLTGVLGRGGFYAGRRLQQATAAQCDAALKQAGGEESLAKQAPKCNVSGFDFKGCCDQVKGLYNRDGFKGCLCNAEVLDYVSNAANQAGIAGVNANTLRTFLKACGVTYNGNGC